MNVLTASETHSEPQAYQQTLFGIAVPRSDPAAEMPSSPPLIADRQEIIERTYDSAEPEFIQMYRAFLLSYAERHEDFIAGEVTAAFGEIHRPVSEIRRQAARRIISAADA
jgi:hypothetical protein